MRKIFLYCLFSGILGEIGGQLSDKRLCKDPQCSDGGYQSIDEKAQPEVHLDDSNTGYVPPPTPVDDNAIPPPNLAQPSAAYDAQFQTPPQDGAYAGVDSSGAPAYVYNPSTADAGYPAVSEGGQYAADYNDPSAVYNYEANMGVPMSNQDIVFHDPSAGGDSPAAAATSSDTADFSTDIPPIDSNLSSSDNPMGEDEIQLPTSNPADDVEQPRGGVVGEEVVGGGPAPDLASENYVDPGLDGGYADVVAQDDAQTEADRSHEGAPITGFLVDYLPGWLHEAAHSAGGINGDRAVLLVVIALTMVAIHLINSCISRSGREKPLLAKLADLDRKLFQSNNELLILRKETMEKTTMSPSDTVPTAQVRELEIQLEQMSIERDQLSNQTRDIQTRCAQFEEEMYRAINAQQEKEKEVEVYRQEKEAALEDARMAQEMVEEMINGQNNNQKDDKLIELVQELQKKLENQQDVLKQYEPRLKKKEKEVKEVTKEMKQLRADLANANLAKEKLRREMDENEKAAEEKSKLLENASKNEEEWKSLADLLQSQLDQKSEQEANLDSELATLKSRMSIYTNELESKEEQLEVLQETVNLLKTGKTKKSVSAERKSSKTEEGGDWEVEGEGWEVEDDALVEEDEDQSEEVDVSNSQEVAKLSVAARRATENLKKLEEEMKVVNEDLSGTKSKLTEREDECETLRTARDETVKELVDTQRRLEVLEQFFNRKEAELQKQLGLQSAKFGDASVTADTTAKKLISVTEELESTKGAMQVLKGELEEQERSLKASVALQEKKAHENWVAARQAERKLTDLQTEVGSLRNRLTVAESKASNLEQEKVDLQATVQALHANKPESVNGVNGTADSTAASDTSSVQDPASLPPLPGLPLSNPMTPSIIPGLPLPTLPGMMVPPLFGAPGLGGAGPASLGSGTGGGLPGMLDSRPPPLGRMSPPSRDRDMSFRSNSPPRGRDYSPGRGGRDYSPSTRSERRGGRRTSPRRGPSPTRSDRGYYRDSDNERSYRRSEGRYDRRDDRRRNYDDDYDRRGDDFYDRRGGREYLKEPLAGPKTSSPLDPPQTRKNFAV